MLRFAFLALALTTVASSTAAAQIEPIPAPTDIELADSMRVSLLTMMPGREAYSLFGHSALRIRDDASGLDRTYNFGTFDFDQPFFVARFLRGSLDYQLATAPYEWLLMDYELQERPIIEQTLALDAETSRELYDLLEVNALPENRSYRYDFFWDNCSTRLLDALDAALTRTGNAALSLPPPDNPQTFRQLLKPYTHGSPLLDAGLNLALALPGDRVATAREETFLPLELAAQLDRATVAGRPLVASRDTVFWLPDAGLPDRAFPWPLALAWMTFGLVALLSARAWTQRTPARGLDRALFGLVGASGLILFLLWVATSHAVMRPNLNLLWAWPTHLFAVWGVSRPSSRWRLYFVLTAVVTGATVLAWAVLPQQLPAVALPIALAITLRAGVLGWGSPRQPVETA
ncbi:MAG: DUF4105 domain-containing protein [Rubricoccaceae bacterium]